MGVSDLIAPLAILDTNINYLPSLKVEQSHTPRHLVTASLCFRGLFFWDALYTRNRDSERAMINANLERRFETELAHRLSK